MGLAHTAFPPFLAGRMVSVMGLAGRREENETVYFSITNDDEIASCILAQFIIMLKAHCPLQPRSLLAALCFIFDNL